MASDYIWNINPFQDFLFEVILNDIDISDKEMKSEIHMAFSRILEYYVPDKYENQYLSFDIKNKKGSFKVIAKNIVTALWLSGIFPANPKKVIGSNEYIIENTKYKFNPKTNKLTYKIIKK